MLAARKAALTRVKSADEPDRPLWRHGQHQAGQGDHRAVVADQLDQADRQRRLRHHAGGLVAGLHHRGDQVDHPGAGEGGQQPGRGLRHLRLGDRGQRRHQGDLGGHVAQHVDPAAGGAGLAGDPGQLAVRAVQRVRQLPADQREQADRPGPDPAVGDRTGRGHHHERDQAAEPEVGHREDGRREPVLVREDRDPGAEPLADRLAEQAAAAVDARSSRPRWVRGPLRLSGAATASSYSASFRRISSGRHREVLQDRVAVRPGPRRELHHLDELLRRQADVGRHVRAAGAGTGSRPSGRTGARRRAGRCRTARPARPARRARRCPGRACRSRA